jgi:signal transduction histidine kinase
MVLVAVAQNSPAATPTRWPDGSQQEGHSPGRRWEIRRLGVVLGTVLGLLLPFGWLALVLTAGPSDGTGVKPAGRWDGAEVTVARTFGPTPLRKEDRVVAIDGIPLQQWAHDSEAVPPRRVGDVVHYTIVRKNQLSTVQVTLHRYPWRHALAVNWVLLTLVLALGALAVVVVLYRPHDHAAWVLVGLAAVIPVGFAQWPWGVQAIDLAGGRGVWPAVVGGVAWAVVRSSLLPHFALVFPVPPASVQRRPWLAGAVYLGPAVLCGIYLAFTLPGARNGMERLALLEAVLVPVSAAGVAVALGLMVWSYLRNSDRQARQRMRWVGGTLLFALLAGLVLDQLPSRLIGRPLLPPHLEPLLFLLCVLAVGASILRYQLFDIEVILKRSLVYGLLTAVLLLLYALTVVVLRGLFVGRSEFGALGATAVVALCFHPLRSRLRRVVGRMIYGDRDDPYEVVSRLGRLEPGDSPDRLLPALAETLAHSLRLPFVRIELDHPDGTFQARAGFGEEPRGGSPLTVPLRRGKEVTGRLLLYAGVGREPLGPAERQLLDGVGRQIGGAVQTALLAEALQRSRQRVIAGREEERRRIRRDLHDGLGPTLAAIVMQLDAAQGLLQRDPDAAGRVLALVRQQAGTAIADIRRVVDELRPASLDQLGLVGAIRERAYYFGAGADSTRAGLRVRIDTQGDLDMLPAAVEVAAFRIAIEAVNNAARHSGAAECVVLLRRDTELHVEVRDDGRGLPEAFGTGVGLGSMRERALELGGSCRVEQTPRGGTIVRATIPIDPAEEASHDDGNSPGPDRR